MGNLGLAGVTSLRALNEWISVINTNITNTQRVGYKETRISLGSGNVDTIGKTMDRLGISIQIPGATLQVDKTLILDYEQGLLNPTGTITEFGINGRGYFVVEDSHGNRFATRDGTFHFDNEGYLTTSQGLRVLSAGQDYIRASLNDQFYVDASGRTTNLGSYGDREFMMIDLPNPGKLYYSQYGFTTFELGNLIPLAFENNFDKTMDGLNPYLIDPSYQANFTHDKTTGTVNMAIDDGAGNAIDSNALVTAHRFTDFRNSFRFVPASINNVAGPPADGFTSIGFSFGQEKVTDTVADSGYAASVYQDTDGNVRLAIYDRNGFVDGINLNIPGGLNSATEYEFSLIVDNGSVSVTLSEAATGNRIITGNTNIILSSYKNGYQLIGTGDIATLNSHLGAAGLASLADTNAGDSVILTKLGVKEINKQPYYDMVITGGSAEKLDSILMQYHLEESTSTISDQIPLLANTQKVFSSISKIINMHNSLNDDLNNLIR